MSKPRSHDSEKRLIKKCRELNAEIVSNATKARIHCDSVNSNTSPFL